MNTVIKFFVLANVCVANAFGFSVSSANNLFRQVKQRQYNTQHIYPSMTMYELSRRNMLRFATAAFGMPTNGYADADDNIAWTLHNGPFNVNNLNDYTKTDSGLLYKDIVLGSGPFPDQGDAVRIEMVGYIFESGQKWANTYKGIPTYYSVVRVGVTPNQQFMKGLNEGIQTMQRGGKRILVIPAYLACNYTEKIPGDTIIPHGSSLVCYVEV
jgi:peptidylprolyl isomerase